MGEIDEITLDAAKAYTAEQGEEEYERIGEWWPDWIFAEKTKMCDLPPYHLYNCVDGCYSEYNA